MGTPSAPSASRAVLIIFNTATASPPVLPSPPLLQQGVADYQRRRFLLSEGRQRWKQLGDMLGMQL